MADSTKLQVLISTLGPEGIGRVVNASHPQIPGVEYLVSWQLPDEDLPIPDELIRPDFKIFKTKSSGLSRNRNNALKAASAPLCLISDDDVAYSSDQLQSVIHAFNENISTDIITFRFSTQSERKYYPEFSFPLNHPPKMYYISSIEIAFRRDKVIQSGILFNENYGIGAEFMAFEENIFIHDLLKAGLTGIYLPVTIASHAATSTGGSDNNPDFIKARGAAFTHLHKFTWPLRMMAHAMRHGAQSKYNVAKPTISRFKYIKLWLKGAFRAYTLKQ